MVKGLFGDNLRDTVRVLKGTKSKESHTVEFPMCYHPELMPTGWNQPRPEPARSIGECPIHNYICPVCGFGAGSLPSCGCPEMR